MVKVESIRIPSARATWAPAMAVVANGPNLTGCEPDGDDPFAQRPDGDEV